MIEKLTAKIVQRSLRKVSASGSVELNQKTQKSAEDAKEQGEKNKQMKKLRKWLLRKLRADHVYVVTTLDDNDKILNFVTNSYITAQRQFEYWRQTFGGHKTCLASKKLEYFDPSIL